jgi:hypothetical protein
LSTSPWRSSYRYRARKIVSTVCLRPDFTIGVAPHPSKPDHEVAVVRIEPGTETPYMFTPDRKVSIRVEDQNLSASLTDLEGLFQRRGAPPAADFVHEDRARTVASRAMSRPVAMI